MCSSIPLHFCYLRVFFNTIISIHFTHFLIFFIQIFLLLPIHRQAQNPTSSFLWFLLLLTHPHIPTTLLTPLQPHPVLSYPILLPLRQSAPALHTPSSCPFKLSSLINLCQPSSSRTLPLAVQVGSFPVPLHPRNGIWYQQGALLPRPLSCPPFTSSHSPLSDPSPFTSTHPSQIPHSSTLLRSPFLSVLYTLQGTQPWAQHLPSFPFLKQTGMQPRPVPSRPAP